MKDDGTELECRKILRKKIEEYILENNEFNISSLGYRKREKVMEKSIDRVILFINTELNLKAQQILNETYKEDESLKEEGIYSDKWFGRFLKAKPNMIDYLNNEKNQKCIEEMIRDVLTIL